MWVPIGNSFEIGNLMLQLRVSESVASWWRVSVPCPPYAYPNRGGEALLLMVLGIAIYYYSHFRLQHPSCHNIRKPTELRVVCG